MEVHESILVGRERGSVCAGSLRADLVRSLQLAAVVLCGADKGEDARVVYEPRCAGMLVVKLR